MEFSKNRLGQVGQKMYFNFDNGVTFDAARYQRDLLNEAMVAEEREKLESEEGAFDCLLYTSPSPRDRTRSRMPSSA